MNKLTPGKLVPNNRYLLEHNGRTFSAVFLGAKLVGMNRFLEISFRSACYGDRWVFLDEDRELEFRKGWNTKRQAGLVLDASDTDILKIFNPQ